jgi:hypothetical protein
MKHIDMHGVSEVGPNPAFLNANGFRYADRFVIVFSILILMARVWIEPRIFSIRGQYTNQKV